MPSCWARVRSACVCLVVFLRDVLLSNVWLFFLPAHLQWMSVCACAWPVKAASANCPLTCLFVHLNRMNEWINKYCMFKWVNIYYTSHLRPDGSWNTMRRHEWLQTRVSFTQSDSASFHPSVPLSQFPSLHSQFPFHLFLLIFPSHHLPLHTSTPSFWWLFFNRFQKGLCFSSHLSVSSWVLPCVCPLACWGKLCTQWLVCSARPSAQQPPLLFNVTGPLLLLLSTVGGFSSVWRFPFCSWCLLWKENNTKPGETAWHYILTVFPLSYLS